MASYKCTVCGYVYDESKEGTPWAELPNDWKCPVCKSGKDKFTPLEAKETKPASTVLTGVDATFRDPYVDYVHHLAKTGSSVIEPMRTARHVPGWEEVLIKGAQLATIPLNCDVPVKTETVIGPAAKKPIIIDTPVYVTHMSFGTLSREAKIALATGSAAARTIMCSGEGGLVEESFKSAYKYILEYVPNKYSITEENLKRVDGIEIKIGQSAKPGMGSHLSRRYGALPSVKTSSAPPPSMIYPTRRALERRSGGLATPPAEDP
jgi:rubredoxin